MAVGGSGDSSLQDRRKEQIGSDKSSSFRTSSGREIRRWELTTKSLCQNKDLEKVVLDKSHRELSIFHIVMVIKT